MVYAPSFSADAFQNADLCEYLASHGYIVLASPTLGAERRNAAFSVAGVELQAADIRFLLDYAATLPQADIERAAVMGYSWGGLAAVFAAAKDARIKALVQLDGSVRYLNKLVDQAGYVSAESVKAPMIYFAHYPDSLESLIEYKQDLSGSLINKLKAADLYLFNMNAMDHVHFSSWFFRSRDPAGFVEYTPAEVSLSYSWMARYSLEFLNARLKDDAAAKAFLTARPESNGVPRHFMRAAIRRE